MTSKVFYNSLEERQAIVIHGIASNWRDSLCLLQLAIYTRWDYYAVLGLRLQGSIVSALMFPNTDSEVGDRSHMTLLIKTKKNKKKKSTKCGIVINWGMYERMIQKNALNILCKNIEVRQTHARSFVKGSKWTLIIIPKTQLIHQELAMFKFINTQVLQVVDFSVSFTQSEKKAKRSLLSFTSSFHFL